MEHDINKRRGLEASVPISAWSLLKRRGFEVRVLINAGDVYYKFYVSPNIIVQVIFRVWRSNIVRRKVTPVAFRPRGFDEYAVLI